MRPLCPAASTFVLRVCLKERCGGRGKVGEKDRKRELCDFSFQVLHVKDQGRCFCPLNVVEKCDSRRGGEVGRQTADEEKDSSVE